MSSLPHYQHPLSEPDQFFRDFFRPRVFCLKQIILDVEREREREMEREETERERLQKVEEEGEGERRRERERTITLAEAGGRGPLCYSGTGEPSSQVL